MQKDQDGLKNLKHTHLYVCIQETLICYLMVVDVIDIIIEYAFQFVSPENLFQFHLYPTEYSNLSDHLSSETSETVCCKGIYCMSIGKRE